jgi:hypothetical protein
MARFLRPSASWPLTLCPLCPPVGCVVVFQGLCGGLPESLTRLTQLTAINLSGNSLQGTSRPLTGHHRPLSALTGVYRPTSVADVAGVCCAVGPVPAALLALLPNSARNLRGNALSLPNDDDLHTLSHLR